MLVAQKDGTEVKRDWQRRKKARETSEFVFRADSHQKKNYWDPGRSSAVQPWPQFRGEVFAFLGRSFWTRRHLFVSRFSRRERTSGR